MRILYIGAFRLPNFDAAAARVLSNAKAFKAAGHDVSFISWGGAYRDDDLCSDGTYKVDGFEYIITNELDPKGDFLSKIYQQYIRGCKTISILRNMTQLPNLIILYNASNKWTKEMKKFCEFNNIKLANDITEWYDNNEIRLTNMLPNYINMTHTQHLVKNKIVISSYLNEYYKDSNNLLLPPLCDFELSKWSNTISDERIQAFNGVTLIYAGNPAKKDCVHTVINAVNALANEGYQIRFVILGVSRETYLKNYRNKLFSNDLNKNIIFLGRVSQDLIPAYYKMADFMVLLREPSRKNMAGFPTKFAESMVSGVPVIANATSDIHQYLQNGQNGFIVNGFRYLNILETLRDRVLTLSRVAIDEMKNQTRISNSSFDCKNYMNSIDLFICNLR